MVHQSKGNNINYQMEAKYRRFIPISFVFLFITGLEKITNCSSCILRLSVQLSHVSEQQNVAPVGIVLRMVEAL